MTKFEQIGVNYQHQACTKEDAMKAFKYSCDCCCARGMHIECDRCAIATAHSLIMACFDSIVAV